MTHVTAAETTTGIPQLLSLASCPSRVMYSSPYPSFPPHLHPPLPFDEKELLITFHLRSHSVIMHPFVPLSPLIREGEELEIEK